MQRYRLSAVTPERPAPDGAGKWVRFTDAEAHAKAARRQALEDAAKVAEYVASASADMALEELPENARNREAMEAAATRLAVAIRAMVEDADA